MTFMKYSLVIVFIVCSVLFAEAAKDTEENAMAGSVISESSEESFAVQAAFAVESKLPAGTEFYVDKAYVRTEEEYEECMLYTTIKDAQSEKTDMYRVVISFNEPKKINVYSTLDTGNAEFLKFYNSTDQKARDYANELKSYSDAIAAADKEIQIGTPSWVKIDCTMINKALSKPEETAAVSQ